VLNTAVEVGKVVDEVNTPEEKQKIFKENGMEVKEDGIELAWEELMQVKLASLASKKVVAGKKQGKQVQPVVAGKKQGKQVQPSAGGRAAEAGDEDASEEEGVELNGEEKGEDEKLAQGPSWSSWSERRSGRPRPRSLWRSPTGRAEAAGLAVERNTARWT